MRPPHIKRYNVLELMTVVVGMVAATQVSFSLSAPVFERPLSDTCDAKSC